MQEQSLPFSGSPHLAQLSWPSPLDTPRDPQIPWTQISHLRLTSKITPFAALETISLCPQSKEFATRLAAENHEDRHHSTMETHCLQILDLRVRDDCDLFFDSLILPEPREFRLSSPVTRCRGFLDLLTRSKCKLYKIELCDFSFEPVMECLEHEIFKSIQELGIYSSLNLTDNELTRLTDLPSPPCTSRITTQADASVTWMVPSHVERQVSGNDAFAVPCTAWT